MKKFLPLLILTTMLAASVYADIRGAESDVKGSVSDVSSRTQSAFKQLGIAQTGQSTEKSGTLKTLSGKKGNMDVDVELKPTANNETHVDVIAKQGALKWNNDYAQNVLSKIIQNG